MSVSVPKRLHKKTDEDDLRTKFRHFVPIIMEIAKNNQLKLKTLVNQINWPKR